MMFIVLFLKIHNLSSEALSEEERKILHKQKYLDQGYFDQILANESIIKTEIVKSNKVIEEASNFYASHKYDEALKNLHSVKYSIKTMNSMINGITTLFSQPIEPDKKIRAMEIVENKNKIISAITEDYNHLSDYVYLKKSSKNELEIKHLFILINNGIKYAENSIYRRNFPIALANIQSAKKWIKMLDNLIAENRIFLNEIQNESLKFLNKASLDAMMEERDSINYTVDETLMGLYLLEQLLGDCNIVNEIKIQITIKNKKIISELENNNGKISAETLVSKFKHVKSIKEDLNLKYKSFEIIKNNILHSEIKKLLVSLETEIETLITEISDLNKKYNKIANYTLFKSYIEEEINSIIKTKDEIIDDINFNEFLKAKFKINLTENMFFNADFQLSLLKGIVRDPKNILENSEEEGVVKRLKRN